MKKEKGKGSEDLRLSLHSLSFHEVIFILVIIKANANHNNHTKHFVIIIIVTYKKL